MELLVGEVLSLEDEDLIEEEDVVITLTNNGYIKRVASTEFRSQRRESIPSRLIIGIPLAVRPYSGTSYPFARYTRPLLVKNSNVS
jgi:DNA gyrase/topoisomerase IV subunit A